MSLTLTTSETTHMEITCLPQPIDNQHKYSKTTKTSCRLQLCDPYFKPHDIYIRIPKPPFNTVPDPPFLFGGGSGNKTTTLHERRFPKQYVLGHILSLLSMVGGGGGGWGLMSGTCPIIPQTPVARTEHLEQL